MTDGAIQLVRDNSNLTFFEYFSDASRAEREKFADKNFEFFADVYATAHLLPQISIHEWSAQRSAASAYDDLELNLKIAPKYTGLYINAILYYFSDDENKWHYLCEIMVENSNVRPSILFKRWEHVSNEQQRDLLPTLKLFFRRYVDSKQVRFTSVQKFIDSTPVGPMTIARLKRKWSNVCGFVFK